MKASVNERGSPRCCPKCSFSGRLIDWHHPMVIFARRFAINLSALTVGGDDGLEKRKTSILNLHYKFSAAIRGAEDSWGGINAGGSEEPFFGK